MIYLSASESQGFALLQTLATDVPVLAWDRGGYWQDPNYYPHRVLFGPVTSVPYWDDRCGDKFVGAADFEEKHDPFWSKVLKKEPFTVALRMSGVRTADIALDLADCFERFRETERQRFNQFAA